METGNIVLTDKIGPWGKDQGITAVLEMQQKKDMSARNDDVSTSWMHVPQSI